MVIIHPKPFCNFEPPTISSNVNQANICPSFKGALKVRNFTIVLKRISTKQVIWRNVYKYCELLGFNYTRRYGSNQKLLNLVNLTSFYAVSIHH